MLSVMHEQALLIRFFYAYYFYQHGKPHLRWFLEKFDYSRSQNVHGTQMWLSTSHKLLYHSWSNTSFEVDALIWLIHTSSKQMCRWPLVFFRVTVTIRSDIQTNIHPRIIWLSCFFHRCYFHSEGEIHVTTSDAICIRWTRRNVSNKMNDEYGRKHDTAYSIFGRNTQKEKLRVLIDNGSLWFLSLIQISVCEEIIDWISFWSTEDYSLWISRI